MSTPQNPESFLLNSIAVSFLTRYEADGIQLKNCPGYIHEWSTGERNQS